MPTNTNEKFCHAKLHAIEIPSLIKLAKGEVFFSFDRLTLFFPQRPSQVSFSWLYEDWNQTLNSIETVYFIPLYTILQKNAKFACSYDFHRNFSIFGGSRFGWLLSDQKSTPVAWKLAGDERRLGETILRLQRSSRITVEIQMVAKRLEVEGCWTWISSLNYLICLIWFWVK